MAIKFLKICPLGPLSHRRVPASCPMNGVGARGPRVPGPARAQNVPKTLQDRMCWACRAGDVGTRSYDDTMPIGMIAHARIRVYHAGDPAAPSCEKEEGGHVRLGDTI